MSPAFPFTVLQAQLEHAISRIASARVIAHALIEAKGKTDMSITGADSFAGLLRERLSAAKAQITALHQEMDAVVTSGENLVPATKAIVKQAKAEVADLEAEVRQLSNEFAGKI